MARQLMFMMRIDRLEQDLRSTPNLNERKIIFRLSLIGMSLSHDEVDQLITFCLQEHCYNCAITAAVCFRNLGQVLRRMPDLGWRFWKKWLTSLVYGKEWSRVREVLSHFSGSAFPKLLYTLGNSFKDCEGLDAFRMLLNRCSRAEESVIVQLVQTVAVGGHTRKFKILLHSNNAIVRQHVLNFTTGDRPPILHHKQLARHLSSESCSNVNDCLSAALEAGLYTTAGRHGDYLVRRRMEISAYAVRLLMQDAVHFLYSAGVMSNRAVFELRVHESLLKHLRQQQTGPDDKKAAFDANAYTARQIRDFLSHAASRPRSLRVLSLLEVSKHIACSHERESIIDGLHIPHILKDQLKFKGCRKLLKP